MPIEPPTWSVVASTTNGSRSRASRLSATASACSWPTAPCRRIPNSSPPSRATVSPSRSVARSRAADLLQQPVALVVAERVVDLLEVVEVHQHHRAALRAPRIASSTRSRNSTRLGRPVRASWTRLVLLGDRGGAAAVDRVERQEEERDQRERVVGGEHDDRREAEHQAGGGRLGEPVVDEVAPDAGALDHRHDGGDERGVDDEERERRREDGRHVGGLEVELRRSAGRPTAAESTRPAATTAIAYCAMLKAILRGLLAQREVGDEVGQEQAQERGLDAAGDQQRHGEGRRRRRLPLRAARVDLERHELPEQRAGGEQQQLVLAEPAGAAGPEQQHAAARDQPEGGHDGDVAAEVAALLHHFRAFEAVIAGPSLAPLGARAETLDEDHEQTGGERDSIQLSLHLDLLAWWIRDTTRIGPFGPELE